MPCEIQINETSYNPAQFIKAKFEESYLVNAQAFIYNWINNGTFVFKSSGSTGKPKSLTFEKWQLEVSAQATIKALELKNKLEHILLCIDPKFVGGAMMLARALILECPISIMKPEGSIFAKLPNSHPYTFASFVPIQLLDKSFSKVKFGGFKNVLIGGSSISNSLEERLMAFEVNCFHSYGMTETLSHVALKYLKKDNGYRVISPYSIRINELNQICVNVPFLREELVTNDLGKWINDDQFVLFGRHDFVINSGGIKIHPEEIEKKIIATGILTLGSEIILGSLPNERLGNELVLITNDSINQNQFEKIQIKLKELGLNYEIPKRFFYINHFPMLESGKISRLKINEWLVNQ